MVVDDDAITLWDHQTGLLKKEVKSILDCTTDAIISATFYGSSMYVAGYCPSVMTTHLWDISSGRYLRRLHNDADVTRLAFSRDGATLASYTGATLRLWDTATGNLKSTHAVDSLHSSSVWFSENGSFIHFEGLSFGLQFQGPFSKQNATGVGYLEPNRYRVRSGDSWIAKGNTNMLWLPPGYRPTVWDTLGSNMVLGCGSRVVLVRFA